MKIFLTRYFVISFTIFLIVFNVGCRKFEFEKPPEHPDKILKTRTTTADRYKYHGITYVLYFDSDDTTGIPTNSGTADSLVSAIGDNPYQIAYDYDYPNITFIEDIEDDNEGDYDNTALYAPTCMYAEFFEDVNFGGASFCIDNRFVRHAVLYNNSTLCSEAYGDDDLSTRSLGGGNWNDRISSFKMFQSGASKTWYDSHGYSGTNTSVMFRLYRDANLATGGCKSSSWTTHLPGYPTNAADWEVPTLKKEKWGFLCTNMNDRTSSIGWTLCRCSNACFKY